MGIYKATAQFGHDMTISDGLDGDIRIEVKCCDDYALVYFTREQAINMARAILQHYKESE